MKRAVVYARVSTERQADEGLSVDSQIDACQRKAAELGAAVVGVYRDDGISGTTDARPGFRAAIHHCARGIDYLVCWSSSRFARDQHDAITYKRELAAGGTRLVYASQQLDLSTHEGWLADSFQQIIDENYSRQVSADTRRSMIKAASDGYFMGGREPFGYRAVPVPGTQRRRLEVDEAEAAVVRWMFAQSAEGAGAVAIARDLNRQGHTLRGRRWGKTTVLNLLKSEVYMGKVIYNRFDRKTRRERPQSEWIRVDAHAPIVLPEAFQAAQRAMDDRVPTAGHVPANTLHLFAGLLSCEICQAGMKMTSGKGRNGTHYHYYACNSAVQGKGCGFKPLPADRFDQWMLGVLLDRVLTTENMTSLVDQLEGAAERWVRDRAARRAALVVEMRTAESRRSKLFDVLETHGKDAPGVNEMGPRLRELNDTIQRLERALAAVEDEQPPAVGLVDVEPAEAAAVLRRMVEECQDPMTLRGFVASIVEGIVVGPNEVRADYRPDCLIHEAGAMVHSTRNWLPVVRLLRTAQIREKRPVLRVA